MCKFKITATNKQLKSFGISYDISGLEGVLIKKFDTGWYCLEVTHVVNEIEFINAFDIPKTFLEKV